MWDKTNFDDLYDQDTPKAYLTRMDQLKYDISWRVRKQFLTILSRVVVSGEVNILDVGSSYGIVSAALNYDESICHWHKRIAGLSNAEVAQADTQYFRKRRKSNPSLAFIGFDRALMPLQYAKKVGLIRSYVHCNIENQTFPSDSSVLRSIDVIVSTGCIGYVTERTFSYLLQHSEPKYVIFTCLRVIRCEKIVRLLTKNSYSVEILNVTPIPQRIIGSEVEIFEQERKNYLAIDEIIYLAADVYLATHNRVKN